MTTLALELVRKIQAAEPRVAWRELFTFAWQTCSDAVSGVGVAGEMSRRDRAVAPADLFLATAGWDLWSTYYDDVPLTSDRLAVWWRATPPGRAVLILDALSIREAPWLVRGAAERGYSVNCSEVTGAELPADTNSFAQAMGFAQRSALENDGAGGEHRLPGARTDSVDLPWRECVDLLDAAPDWVLWHHWPDHRIHDLSAPGRGLSKLAKEVATQLADDHFWALIDRLTTGRRLVITGDHGYAATGLFPDAADNEQTRYLKERFKSGRSAHGTFSPGNWVPPLDLALETPHGPHAFVLGRRKWKSPGGYPTLAHGGLSLLEVVVPFIELSSPSGS
ncbi:MAG: hypothetical protein OXJ90_08195 [Spirochaetaceae bacterium]|nr:hypothetical protein [Spirochaetaceae bacterium]